MPIIRRKLDPNTVYPEGIRYNPDTDTVQSNIGGTWVDNPAADPRKQTTFPPRITSSPACDAGRSVADALKNQINGIIDAIANAKTAFTIAGIILSLFTFGVFGIFISIALGIADAMIGAGSTALLAALPDSVFDTLACILYCQFNSGGRLKAGGLAQAMSDVNDQIGGLGATIINAMLSLAGEGGVNNLASLGTSTGDCSECGCGWCYYFDFSLTDGDWIATSDFPLTTWTTGVGWVGALQAEPPPFDNDTFLGIGIDIPGDPVFVNSITVVRDNTGATSGFQQLHVVDNSDIGHDYAFSFETGEQTQDISLTIKRIEWKMGAADTPIGQITNSIKVRGTGVNPWGTDNCP
jgi:hypothetical protein